jgi:hypothetical protein
MHYARKSGRLPHSSKRAGAAAPPSPATRSMGVPPIAQNVMGGPPISRPPNDLVISVAYVASGTAVGIRWVSRSLPPAAESFAARPDLPAAAQTFQPPRRPSGSRPDPIPAARRDLSAAAAAHPALSVARPRMRPRSYPIISCSYPPAAASAALASGARTSARAGAAGPPSGRGTSALAPVASVPALVDAAAPSTSAIGVLGPAAASD